MGTNSRTTDRNQAVLMRCLRRVLAISYTKHTTTSAVRKIAEHLKHTEELLASSIEENIDDMVM